MKNAFFVRNLDYHRALTTLTFELYTSIPVGGRDSGLNAILAGGHCPGSLLLHWETNPYFAVPSAASPDPVKTGVISVTFFWSDPNRVVLRPDDIHHTWLKVKDLDPETAFGAFESVDIYTKSNESSKGTDRVKGRLLENCKI